MQHMFSTFSQGYSYSCDYNCDYTPVYSKTNYEVSKQQLQLRPKPLITFPSRPRHDKLVLQYIEKERRVSGSSQARQMSISTHRKPPPLMRAPSSGFSSSTSSENLFSGLSIGSEEQHIREILDPAVEVDLDIFLRPEVRYKQPVPMSSCRRNVAMRQVASNQKGVPAMAPQMDLPCFSNSNSGHMAATSHHAPELPPFPGTWMRCQYCWETYLNLCQRAGNLDAMLTYDGPWLWHNLYDSQGRVTCPRLWFAQFGLGGMDVMSNVRDATC